MGYYTMFELEVEGSNGDSLIGEFLEFCEGARYALEPNGDTYDATKWYDCDNDLKSFSKKHPETLFILDGKGEDSCDIWKAYFKNGKMQKEKAEIVFGAFDESELK